MTSNKCILCNIEGVDFGTKPEYNKYTREDPSGVSSGIRRYFSFLKCPKCSLFWVKDPEENYDSIYSTGRFWNEYQNGIRGLPKLTERFDNDIKYAKLRMPEILRFIKQGNALDIGCSSGALVKELKANSFNAEGMDLDTEACILAQEFSKCPVHNNLDKCPNGCYDFVAAIDVLEHLENPLETVQVWINKLKMGGVLLIECPDSGCSHALNNGITWDYVTPGEHLYYYTQNHVKTLLEKFNCIVLESGTVFTTDRQRVIAKKLF